MKAATNTVAIANRYFNELNGIRNESRDIVDTWPEKNRSLVITELL